LNDHLELACPRDVFEVISFPFKGGELHRSPFRRDRVRRGVGTGTGIDLTARPRLANLIDSIKTGSRRSPRGTSIVKVSVKEYFFEVLRSGRSFFPYFQTNDSTDQACCEKIARNDFFDGEASGVMFLRRTLQEWGGLHGPSYLLWCSADRSPSAVSSISFWLPLGPGDPFKPRAGEAGATLHIWKDSHEKSTSQRRCRTKIGCTVHRMPA